MTLPPEIIDKIASPIISIFMSKLSKYLSGSEQNNFDLQKSISSHLIEVSNWSERIQFYGMDKAKHTDSDTIKLTLLTPRKFRSKSNKYEEYDEKLLLQDNNHYLLLGDPGSGKTTTLKRLARNLLTASTDSSNDFFQYPIVIPLRELEQDICLYKHITKIFGLKYRVEHEKNEQGQIIETKTYIENELIEKAIPNILNNTKPILLIDGLDEVSPLPFQRQLISEIESLGRKLNNAKIILTCRSGNFIRTIEGFDLFEICPLSIPQVRNIANIWLNNSIKTENFLEDLEKLPYYDLVDRPLMLCQLLHYYNHYDCLPKQPSLIYKKTIELFLKEWDEDRNIERSSRYCGFHPEVKAEFLSEMAYLLTYNIKKKVFSEENLIQSYYLMYESFDLPKNEAKQVAREIESHTGIITKSTENNYEFSHLSIQEYLCANYIVRCAFSSNIKQYISEYPAPLAVAVSLSSNPSVWLAGLILKHHNCNRFSEESLSVLLSRLFIENPKLKAEMNLGFAVLKIISEFYDENKEFLTKQLLKLFNIKNVKKSLALALVAYVVLEGKNDNSDHYHLRLADRNLNSDDEFPQDYEYQYPLDCSIPKQIIDNIMSDYELSFLLDNDNETGQAISLIKEGKQDNRIEICNID